MATGTSGTERTIGQLVADATHDLEGIVRGEIALAKAEVTDGAKVLGKGAGLLAGAAFLAAHGGRLPPAQRGLGHRRVAARLGRLPHRRRRRADRRRRPRPARQEGPRRRPARRRSAPSTRPSGPSRSSRSPFGDTRDRSTPRRVPRRRLGPHRRHRHPAPRAPPRIRHAGATGRPPAPRARTAGAADAVSLRGTPPSTRCATRSRPRRRTGAISSEGERVAGVRVVERGREDHADDTAPRRSITGPPEAPRRTCARSE